MKKTILFISAALFSAVVSMAIPAYPKPVTVTQPDGSRVTLQLHGDEFYHWMTSSGVVVSKSPDGYYRKVSSVLTKSSPLTDANAIAKAKEKRLKAAQVREKAAYSGLGHGQNHFLVILVEFADTKFTVSDPNTAFKNMLNEVGYSANSATGSAYDYFAENSSGDFKPVFDVVGPVTLTGNVATYGGNDTEGNDKAPEEAFYEACQLANSQGLVDFSKYDNDNNGYVDNVFFYYAGHNEAEYGGEDTIWPHSYGLYSYNATFNGKRVWSYACTSELKGSSGSNMTGIGTFCHEFSHVLGLPDFYDTDDTENGEAQNLPGTLSLMSSGNYNNNGRTPPYLSAMERQMLGWMDSFTTLAPGSVTMEPVTSNAAYTTPTSNSNEFFLYEVRTGEGWDAYIGNESGNTSNVGRFKGLVVYHVDKSKNVVGSTTASSRWSSGSGINDYADHPCYYLKKAKSTAVWAWPFPGSASVSEFSDMSSMPLRSWDGQSTGYSLSDISYSDGKVTATVMKDLSRKVTGTVSDSSGKPISGASVYITTNTAAAVSKLRTQAGPTAMMSQKMVMKTAGAHEVTTASDGTYQISLETGDGSELTLLVTATGYRNHTETFTLSSGGIKKDVTLYGVTESTTAVLKKYGTISGYGIGSASSPCSATVAIRYTADELKQYVGRVFSSISFLVYEDDDDTESAEKIDAFVNFGTERVLTQTVGKHDLNKMITVDVSSQGLEVPDNTTVYIGYSIKNAKTGYPIAIDDPDAEAVDGGGFYTGNFKYCDTGTSTWYQIASTEGYYNIIVSANVSEKVSPFTALGVKTINNPRNGESYGVGDTFTFGVSSDGVTPTQKEWYFDGSRTNADSVVLSAGEHTVKVILTYSDGTTEEIVQVIKAE